MSGPALTDDLPEEAFAAALASAPNVGPATLRRLLALGPPSVAWSRSGFGGGVPGTWRRHVQRGITVLTADNPAYPDRLAGDPEAPPILFCLGDPTALERHPTVALVGTRSPTRYGIGVAAQFGADLAAAGVSVVSGLALGIDGAAHEGACASGAPPVAVVAGGLDDPYPHRHARLWERVATQGAVYSESPAGVRTEKWRFPKRNHLLAGLSDAVVVIESRHGGGSMHTVAAALDRGIPVGAVPGSIRSPTSEGTNKLLSDGCFPVCDVADILVALSLGGAQLPQPPTRNQTEPTSTETRPTVEISAGDHLVWDALTHDPTSLDHLARETGLELASLCGGLERLATAGLVREAGGGWWERI
jgi:DNA processing protein